MRNSRPAEDLDFRYEYASGRFMDELLPYFPPSGPGKVTIPGVGEFSMYGTDACDVHHIWGGRMGRWDRLWNIVMVNRRTHEWVERYKTDGRVIGLRRKLDSDEYDPEDAYSCLGMHPVGWLTGRKCEHAFAEELRLSTIARYG